MNSSKRPTICMFTNYYPPIPSGSSTYCAELSRELVARGSRVFIITSKVIKSSPDFEEYRGVLIYRIPAFRLPQFSITLNFPWLNFTLWPGNRRRILRILRSNHPDVIHAHNHMFDMALHAIGAARRLEIPVVLSIHTIIKHTNRIFDLLLHVIDRLLVKAFIIDKADMLICPDLIVADYVRKTYQARNIVQIPYGATVLPKADPTKVQELRNQYDLENKPVILSLGHLHQTRDRLELIRILPDLVNQFPGLVLMIVGYIGTKSTLKLASKLGVKKNVICTGIVPQSEIPNYLGLTDIEAHWFNKEHQHKTPSITGQEAMSAGKVIITNADKDILGVGVLQDGVNAILVEPGNQTELLEKMRMVLSDPDLREQIGRNARRTIREHLNWDMVIKRMLSAYKSAQAEHLRN